MAIYSLNISNVSRAKGSSSCATLSYITGSEVKDERLGQTFYGFGRKERITMVNTILPNAAPSEYKDPAELFNSIELYEKADNARTAKKVIVALPKELSLPEQIELIEQFIRSNLTKENYCCTYAIHTDQENNNPHAHILIANRQINNKGEWGNKRKMEYVLDEAGERIPIIDKSTGLQKVDKHNRKQWKRINVEQNLLDKKEFLAGLRESWAVECNKHLAPENQIDHRSYEDQGIERVPMIHEGYAAREIEKRGGISERCEENRDIRMSNRLLNQVLEELRSIASFIKGLRKVHEEEFEMKPRKEMSLDERIKQAKQKQKNGDRSDGRNTSWER